VKFVKLVSINLLILIVLILLGEVTLRILFPNLYIYQRTVPNQFKDRAFDKNFTKVLWPQKDYDLGWVCKRDSLLKFSSKYYNSFPIIYKINKEGFRNPVDFSNLKDIDSNKKRLLLLGDSYIMSV